MDRIYSEVIQHHLDHYRQMVFLAGPRQVGKTTISKKIEKLYPEFYYFNWDNDLHRKIIIQGSAEIAKHSHLEKVKETKAIIVFDEIHKYKKWKQFLKGFFDVYEDQCRIIVTGSTKLDVYHRGGDSLMGRYFIYRIFPLSLGEIISTDMRKNEIVLPRKITFSPLEKLMKYGGFPEPYIKADQRFSANWQRLRQQQLLKEDIREVSQIQNFAELEMLMQLLTEESSQLLNVPGIAKQLNVAETTIHRWIKTLKSFYYCFTIKPWFKNVRRSLRKMPKIYLWDWSIISDPGQRYENMIASHLYKSVQYWTDLGFGEFELFFLRDKDKHEVDFLITKNKSPWFMVEAKLSDNQGISDSLKYFYQELKIKYAFQVVYGLDFVNKNCFDYQKPVIVPALTFLSQLV